LCKSYKFYLFKFYSDFYSSAAAAAAVVLALFLVIDVKWGEVRWMDELGLVYVLFNCYGL
jgi:hypothetical protein